MKRILLVESPLSILCTPYIRKLGVKKRKFDSFFSYFQNIYINLIAFVYRKFSELCNEETPMVRRAVAKRIGDFAKSLEKEYVIGEIIPLYKQLSTDDQVVLHFFF